MATVFMKWLETTPKNYDRGIRLLTLGQLKKIKIALVRKNDVSRKKVLDIGCGTGELAILLAQQGAEVVGIDASTLMLEEAEKNIHQAGLASRVELLHLHAQDIREHFPEGAFDLIASTLTFSEFSNTDRRLVLDACRGLLKEGGALLIIDETAPAGTLYRLLYWLVRFPLVLLTWLLTKTTTSTLRNFQTELAQIGFRVRVTEARLGGSLLLYEASPLNSKRQSTLPSGYQGRLEHKVNLRTWLKDIWMLVYRIMPPYPKVEPGLYSIGEPDANSSVLVTGNFDLTIRRVVKELDRKVDAWLLVVDSAGINVWCAAGGGYLTAGKVVSAVKSSGVDSVVLHRALILPQLAANGVDGWQVRRETGWGVHWGPILAKDIPEYLHSKRQKNASMRLVTFPLRDRLEMTAVVIGFYLILLTIPFWLVWRPHFWTLMGFSIAMSLVYSLFLPWIPGQDGIGKGAFLAGMTLLGCLAWANITGTWTLEELWNWTIGLSFLAFFIGAEFQGMSPHMRGEQGNWGIETLVGLGTLAAYFAPRLTGIW